ncbi:MFS transporter [Nonomuraea sp. NPDC059194]|uniref:MFS transporter n=1 Tax=Nonomuraea sp. NPDC059194 TaxID=3346764 RepID=UPI00367FDAE3
MIAAVQLLMVMDGTIVTVGLPVIGAGLHIAEADLDWVLTSYALAFAGLLLAGGRAGDLFGRRRLFRAGLVVFLAASLLGGVAGNGTVLIAARVLQGVGAAIVAPAALSLLADTFPAGPQRNKGLGVYGAMGGLGSVVGLLLGGALTEYLGWRWIMFVNIPIALLVLAGTFALVPGTRERGGGHSRRAGAPGAVPGGFRHRCAVRAADPADDWSGRPWSGPGASPAGPPEAVAAGAVPAAVACV